MCKGDCYNAFFSLPFLQIHFIHPPSQIQVCYLESRVSCCRICRSITWQLPPIYQCLPCKMYVLSYNPCILLLLM